MDHSYEEIRSVALDLLAGREKVNLALSQYEHLKMSVAAVLEKRGETARSSYGNRVNLSPGDSELFREIFWDLFRQGIITLGCDDSNRQFPWFCVSSFGTRLLAGGNAYFFHDVLSYEQAIKAAVPEINKTTSLYLKEAMQAFRSGCILSATVMLGVATEHTFLSLLDTIESSPSHATYYAPVFTERTILNKVNKFKNKLDQKVKDLPSEVKEDLDTNFAGILAVIRNFRNQSGHPTGKIIDRGQAYVLLQLFIPYCKKLHQLIHYFRTA